MHKQQTNGIQGKPKSELWIPIAYAIFYFPTFEWLNAHNFPRYYIGCKLDDLIPFCEWFVIPYVAWFFIIPAMLLLMHSISRPEYRELCFMLFGGMTICLLIYFLLPNGLTLRRPVSLDNWAARLVVAIRHTDQPTNVCPSIHVASSMAIFDVAHSSRAMKQRFPKIRLLFLILCPMICVSTLFLKQHSVIDVCCGILLTAVLRSGITHWHSARRAQIPSPQDDPEI